MAVMRSPGPSMRRAERVSARSGSGRSADEAAGKKKVSASAAWREARDLLRTHKYRLLLGLGLMLISRLAGLVLPASSKYLVDEVIGKGRHELLMPIAVAGGVATAIQAVTSFLNSQILGVAAQRAITEMRKRVQARVMRLPVRYFDSTQTGVLLSRIMSDADGIRNLVGSGLVQLVGGIFTAVLGLGVLLYLNWRLTIVTIIVLVLFGVGMAYAFRTLRPLFRERGKINAEVTGRLTEALGGIRDRQELHRREARGDRLRQGRASAVPQRRQVDDRRLGDDLGQYRHHRHRRRRDDLAWRQRHRRRAG